MASRKVYGKAVNQGGTAGKCIPVLEKRTGIFCILLRPGLIIL